MTDQSTGEEEKLSLLDNEQAQDLGRGAQGLGAVQSRLSLEHLARPIYQLVVGT